MKIGICVDDNAGFSAREAKALDLGVVKMPVVIEGKEYFQNVDLTPQAFYGGLIDKEVHTSMPSPADTFRAWDDLLTRYDHVIYQPMSSGLSSTCMVAKVLSEEEKYKGKVTVVDNHRISVVLKDAVYDAKKLIEEGKSPEEIKEYLEKEALDLKLYIAVDTLKYLVRGGRITPAAKAIASLLGVKPVLKIEGGKLDAKAKVIGMKKARLSMISFLKEDLATFFQGTPEENLYIALAYTGTDDSAALEFRHQVSEAFQIPEGDILLDPLSLSVGVHIGGGALALTAAKVLDKKALIASARAYGK